MAHENRFSPILRFGRSPWARGRVGHLAGEGLLLGGPTAARHHVEPRAPQIGSSTSSGPTCLVAAKPQFARAGLGLPHSLSFLLIA
jgi:hypothetical protein